jgi:hypothetical protein
MRLRCRVGMSRWTTADDKSILTTSSDAIPILPTEPSVCALLINGLARWPPAQNLSMSSVSISAEVEADLARQSTLWAW